MGIRIEDREYGNDCAACWAAGETPAFIYVAFSGVKAGSVAGSAQIANNFWFKCLQNPGQPCTFNYNLAGAGFTVNIWRSAATGRWHVSAFHNGFSLFTGWLAGCPTETSIWTNLNWSPIFFPGWDGYAYCFWMEAALDLVDALEIPNEGHTFLEVFEKDGAHVIYKFCCLKYSLNQTIQIS